MNCWPICTVLVGAWKAMESFVIDLLIGTIYLTFNDRIFFNVLVSICGAI